MDILCFAILFSTSMNFLRLLEDLQDLEFPSWIFPHGIFSLLTICHQTFGVRCFGDSVLVQCVCVCARAYARI